MSIKLSPPALVAQWLRRLAGEPKDAVSIPAAVAAAQMEAKCENVCVDISAHIKDAKVVEVNPEPSHPARP